MHFMDPICPGKSVFDQGGFEDAHDHVEHAKLHVLNNTYLLCHVM